MELEDHCCADSEEVMGLGHGHRWRLASGMASRHAVSPDECSPLKYLLSQNQI